MNKDLNIYFSLRPLSYAPFIAQVINRDTIVRSDFKFLIYEDTPQSIEFLKRIKDELTFIYLLDTTALSAVPTHLSIVDFIKDECRVLLPWSNRIGELKRIYPNKKFFHLPLPMAIDKCSDNESLGRLIAFTGPLESRLAETIRDIGGDSKKVSILDLNDNQDLLKKVIFEEDLGDLEIIVPKSCDELKHCIKNCEQIIYPHNTSLRDLHWSYLYALSIAKPVLLGLRSDIESIPGFVPRYLLGGEILSSTEESYLTDAQNYIKEVHSVDAFNWELKKIFSLINY